MAKRIFAWRECFNGPPLLFSTEKAWEAFKAEYDTQPVGDSQWTSFVVPDELTEVKWSPETFGGSPREFTIVIDAHLTFKAYEALPAFNAFKHEWL